MPYDTIRTFPCPECGKPVNEITTHDDNGFIINQHAFCADSNGGDCLWGGAYPDNSRNVKNNKIREERKLHENPNHNDTSNP